MRIITMTAALFLPGVVWANCPAAPDHRAQLDVLFNEVQAAQTETEAQVLANRMWEFWADAPDERAQEILNRGMERRGAFDLLGALEDFTTLIAYCPEYAEGYNQRAFVYFMQQDYTAALRDLDQALQFDPRHVAAMSGKALSLMGLSRRHEARQMLQRALQLNPWLVERGLLAPNGPLAPEETEL